MPAGGNVLIAAHGNKQGLSLSIGDEKSDVHLEFDALQAIRRNQEGKDSDDETAKILKMTAAAYKTFKSLIERCSKCPWPGSMFGPAISARTTSR